MHTAITIHPSNSSHQQTSHDRLNCTEDDILATRLETSFRWQPGQGQFSRSCSSWWQRWI